MDVKCLIRGIEIFINFIVIEFMEISEKMLILLKNENFNIGS